MEHILELYFAAHCPSTISQRFARGTEFDLDPAPPTSWVGAASALLRPIVDALRRHVLAATTLLADDTPIPVLAAGKGKVSMPVMTGKW